MRVVQWVTPLGLLVVLASLPACAPRLGQASTQPAPTLATPDSPLVRDATATARMATLIVSPAAPTETTVPDLSAFRGLWTTYANTDWGFTFEYPAVYDVEPFKGWGCGVRTSEAGLIFGSDNSLSIVSAEGLGLAQYVDRFIQQQGSSFDPWRRDDSALDAELGRIVVEYFLRGVNHGGLLAFFQRDERIYIFRVRLSRACSMQELDLVSPGPFYHAVESFKFTR